MEDSLHQACGNTELNNIENTLYETPPSDGERNYILDNKNWREKYLNSLSESLKIDFEEHDSDTIPHIIKTIREKEDLGFGFHKLKRIIDGDDDREPVIETIYPYHAICYLFIRDAWNRPSYGTGFFISSRCVITAGHNLCINGNYANTILVVPGAMNGIQPFGSQKSKVFRTVIGWEQQSNMRFDYGAVILPNDKLYQEVRSSFGFEDIVSRVSVEISGYPEDKDNEQFKSVGKIKDFDSELIRYTLDTEDGNSGSPVFIRRGSKSIALGIHTYGDKPNHSVRINQHVMNRFNEWMTL